MHNHRRYNTVLLIRGLAIITQLLIRETCAKAAVAGLMDPDFQPKFVELVPDAFANVIDLSSSSSSSAEVVQRIGAYKIHHETGLIGQTASNGHGRRLATPVFAYGTSQETASWPGPTLMATTDTPSRVLWTNDLYGEYSLPFTSLHGMSVLDESLHWAYSLFGYQAHSVEKDGIPLVTHVHGVHVDETGDGFPEAFYGPGFTTKGPAWKSTTYDYPNDQQAATLWYHDHTMGITRLNVYAGLTGFYIIRDDKDNGDVINNPLHLPAGEYEKAYVIQDRMFKENGELFYPAFKGDPYYDDFITDEDANWDSDVDGPTALAEFFGDFMVVNGKIWPKENVQPRRYRLRLLNGCDSRFLAIKFVAVDAGATRPDKHGQEVISYTIIGTDQGLLNQPLTHQTKSIIETGARLDIVFDFSGYQGKRIIIINEGGDSPFTGTLPGEQLYSYTNMIMAFDVDTGNSVYTTKPYWNFEPKVLWPVNKVRRVGLFEGKDEFSRLQPLLGGELTRNVVESLAWTEATTETPNLNDIEEWEIYNFSGDAHPIHLHLVQFQVVARYAIIYDTSADDEHFCKEGSDGGDGAVNGICLEKKVSNQAHHGPASGTKGVGFKAFFPPDNVPVYDIQNPIFAGDYYNAEIGGAKDTVTALPGQVTKIRAKFDLPGKFVWHCHILAHEDHEMMRVFEVIDNNTANNNGTIEEEAPPHAAPPLTLYQYEGRFNMCCRDSNGQKGKPGVDFVKYTTGYTQDLCSQTCSNDATCQGYEYGASGYCEIWSHWYGFFEYIPGCTCARKQSAIKTEL